jgi:hypothetical protein
VKRFNKGVDEAKWKAPYHDGVQYTWRIWWILVSRVAALSPGDKIYNYYKKEWTVVESVELTWVKPWRYGKSTAKRRGRTIHCKFEAIMDLNVYTPDGYCLCDEVMFGPDELLNHREMKRTAKWLMDNATERYVLRSHL